MASQAQGHRQKPIGRGLFLHTCPDISVSSVTAVTVTAISVLQEEITRFERFDKAPRRRPRADDVDGDTVPEFLNGRSLRPYQLVSLAWMVNNWRSRRNCILGDEMCVCLSLHFRRYTLGFMPYMH